MVTAGLTDEQLKAGWAPADIEYPLFINSILHNACLCDIMKCTVTQGVLAAISTFFNNGVNVDEATTVWV